MPRPKRPSPGGGERGPLSAILGQMLTGAFGGIEADPMFATEDEIGSKPFDKPYQSDSPVKGKTIFDRNEASRINAQYLSNLAQGRNEAAQRLKTEEAMNPILADRTLRTGQASNQNTLELRKALLPIIAQELGVTNQAQLDFLKSKIGLDVESEQKVGAAKNDNARVSEGISMLARNNILPNKANEENYNNATSAPLIQAIVSAATQRDAESQLGAEKAALGSRINQLTSNDQIATALSQSGLGRELAASRFGNAAKIAKNEQTINDQEPLIRESNLVTSRMKDVSPGQSIVDIIARKPAYTAPEKDPLEMLDRLKNMDQQKVGIPTTAPSPATADQEIIEFGGRKYRIIK